MAIALLFGLFVLLLAIGGQQHWTAKRRGVGAGRTR